jgi:hypothetical protein
MRSDAQVSVSEVVKILLPVGEVDRRDQASLGALERGQ